MFCVIILSLFVVAPPLSVDSVMAVLGDVAHMWRTMGVWLRIPDATMSYIDGECKDDLERLRRVVRYWLLKDPSASWRRLIWELYYTDYDDLIKLAGSIKEYLEKLTGQHILSIGPLPCVPPLTPH